MVLCAGGNPFESLRANNNANSAQSTVGREDRDPAPDPWGGDGRLMRSDPANRAPVQRHTAVDSAHGAVMKQQDVRLTLRSACNTWVRGAHCFAVG